MALNKFLFMVMVAVVGLHRGHEVHLVHRVAKKLIRIGLGHLSKQPHVIMD